MTLRQPSSGTPPHGAARTTLRRGVSLIEALVAMAVMAFGMLGVLGLQATLRTNADLSKQRSEATRLAQEKIEEWRSFSVVPTTSGAKSYASEIATVAAQEVTSFNTGTNTTYTRTATVTPSLPASAAASHKTLLVDVTWPDRTGATQRVRLFSAVAQVSPDLAATAVAPPHGLAGVRNPGGRARGIPPQAKNFGDGTSGFRPPQASGSVAWVFSNATGLITSVCTTSALDNDATLNAASLTACVSTQKYQLLNGFIRFATGAAQPSANNIVNPELWTPEAGIEAEVVQTKPFTLAGTVACFHERPPTFYVQYFCAVPVRIDDYTPPPPDPPAVPPVPPEPLQPKLTWEGTLRIKPSTLPTLSGALAEYAGSGRKVCRYRAAATYVGVNTPLTNENLVLIRAGDAVSTPFVCPTAGAGPSWPHQPAT